MSQYGSLFCCFSSLLFLFALRRTVLESVAIVTGLSDMAVVCKPVQQRGYHFWIDEHTRPFRKAQVSRDDDAGAFIEFGSVNERATRHRLVRMAGIRVHQQ